MEDAGEAPPFARPTDTAERPKPKVTDLPDAPIGETSLAPQGETGTPTTTTAKPEAQAQSQTTTQPNAPQQKDPRKIDPKKIGEAIAAGAAGTAAGIGSKEGVDSVQSTINEPFYPETIQWGVQPIKARPYGAGYWGQRTPQQDDRVEAYELKINPENESYYIKHPDGRFVQFENLKDKTVQDGKLVMQINKSFYRVYDKPEILRAKVLNEARRQVEAARHNGLEVEWLVSDETTVEQLQRYFKEKNLDVKVTYFPE